MLISQICNSNLRNICTKIVLKQPFEQQLNFVCRVVKIINQTVHYCRSAFASSELWREKMHLFIYHYGFHQICAISCRPFFFRYVCQAASIRRKKIKLSTFTIISLNSLFHMISFIVRYVIFYSVLLLPLLSWRCVARMHIYAHHHHLFSRFPCSPRAHVCTQYDRTA